MKVASFFSGIGGIDLGLERAGMEISFQCEILPFGQSVLSKHWPGTPIKSDIKRSRPTPEPGAGGFTL